MKRAVKLLLLTLLAGCEGRTIAVFEVAASAGGGQGGSGGTDTAGSGGQSGGSGEAGAATAIGGSETGASGSGGGGGYLGGFAGLGGSTWGQGGPTNPPSCQSNDDCAGLVCDKRSCEPGALGVCVPWPPICDPTPKPVCGCDGITYWNDCLRLQQPNPTALAGPDQCRVTASSCDVGADCGVPYSSCSHLLPPGAQCGHGPGTCWVLPPRCDPSADSKRWRECKPPPDGVAAQCLDTCSAIATEHSYADLHRGEVCN